MWNPTQSKPQKQPMRTEGQGQEQNALKIPRSQQTQERIQNGTLTNSKGTKSIVDFAIFSQFFFVSQVDCLTEISSSDHSPQNFDLDVCP